MTEETVYPDERCYTPLSEWEDPVEDETADEEIETESVRERLADEVDGDLHGLALSRVEDDGTAHVVISRSTTWDALDEGRPDIPVLDIRSVVVDPDAGVRVHENGIWVPREQGVSEVMTRLLARTTSDLGGSTEGEDPALLSAVDSVDAEDLLSMEVEVEEETPDGQHVGKMESHSGIDPSRPWGYGAGPPDEVSYVVDRLQEAGLDPEDHLSRLVWGKKEPMDRVTRPVEELTGNYGIELQPRDSGLVALDVDYPEHFPGSELPETLEVSSPHGSNDRRHILYFCEDKERLAEEIGAWAIQSVEWGDLWVGDRYLVGPGSQLSEFGCDLDPYNRGDRGGCESCEDTEGGLYSVVSDAPIATISADRLLSLLDESDFGDSIRRNGPADPDPPEQEDETSAPSTCDSCGSAQDPEDLLEVDVGGSTRYICDGVGCDE
ncbi:hypothetical protein [Haloarcula sp. CGMCC 1.2071]|uniref:hypothetical protein n=1 Tax=Haloarcula sp. CGMCC 1.2071 TaxID=3111454 RepID=UPI00300E823E